MNNLDKIDIRVGTIIIPVLAVPEKLVPNGTQAG